MLIPQCDNCDDIFEGGFKEKKSKVVRLGPKREFVVDIKIRPPHLCDKCFIKIIKIAIQKPKQKKGV